MAAAAAASKALEEEWVSRGKKRDRQEWRQEDTLSDMYPCPLGGWGDGGSGGDIRCAASFSGGGGGGVAAAAAKRKAPEEGWVKRGTSKERRARHKRI